MKNNFKNNIENLKKNQYGKLCEKHFNDTLIKFIMN